MQLPVPDIDRIDTRRTALQQHLGETAGRGADIERHNSGHEEPEMIQRGDQLEGAARDMIVGSGGHVHVGARGDGGAGLGFDRAGHLHQAAPDQVLRSCARTGQASLDQH